jgi:hypothetical protein
MSGSKRLEVDYIVSREIYSYPAQTSGTTMLSAPHLIYKHGRRLKMGGSEEYGSMKGVILANADAYVLNISTPLPPSIGNGYQHYQDIRANILGQERKYIGMKSAVGHVTPVSTTALKEAVGLASEIGAGIAEFIQGFLTVDIEQGVLYNQPLPNHDVGVIRIRSSIVGVTAEGGSYTDNYAVLSSTDMYFDQIVYTEAMVDYLFGRHLWNEFLMLSSDQRNAAIKFVRESHGLSPKTRRNEPLILPSRAGNYPFWALSRNLDATLPPPDVRKFSYPGYKKRTLTPVR